MFMKIMKWVSSTELPLAQLWLCCSGRPILLLGFAICAGGLDWPSRRATRLGTFGGVTGDGFSRAEL
jgi:hypothetical protein